MRVCAAITRFYIRDESATFNLMDFETMKILGWIVVGVILVGGYFAFRFIYDRFWGPPRSDKMSERERERLIRNQDPNLESHDVFPALDDDFFDG